MAWSYSSWITLTGQARLTQLRLHIQEITNAITAGVTADGESVSPGNLNPVLDRLLDTEKELSATLAGGVFGVPTRRVY